MVHFDPDSISTSWIFKVILNNQENVPPNNNPYCKDWTKKVLHNRGLKRIK